MTKLHNVKGVEGDDTGKRRGGTTVVICALLAGIGLAIGFGVGGQGSAPPPFAQFALQVTSRFAHIDLKAPAVSEPMQKVFAPVQENVIAPMQQHVLGPVSDNILGPVRKHVLVPMQQVIGPLHLSFWPDWGLSSNQGTVYKSAGAVRLKPTIALIIDDCGPDVARTIDAITLPQEVTLSFLPYAPTSFSLSHRASDAHHEVIVHLPMQPVGAENPGPMALSTNLGPAELDRRIDWALSRVSGYDGANNHMGSKFTASRKSLIPVMQSLAVRGLLFLDSRTTPDTVAETVAHQAGMLAGSRDVFLDNEQTAPAVERQLQAAEEFARTHGTAIVIGHPHPETLAALKNWAVSVQARGFDLAPLKAVLEMRAADKTTQTVATAAPVKR
jgi:polysaccharide deacetylase 2 family uncharacterized protein YibQ